MSSVSDARLGEALGTDFFSVREQFTDEQWSRFITVRRFVDEEVVPGAGPYWARAEIPWELIRRLPELGVVGEDINGYGCAGMSALASGLVTMELHRGDGSLGVTLGVHSGLARSRSPSPITARTRSRWKPRPGSMGTNGSWPAASAGSALVRSPTWSSCGPATRATARSAPSSWSGGHPASRQRSSKGRLRCGPSGRPTSPWTTCGCRRITGYREHAPSPMPPGSLPRPAAPVRGLP